MRKMARFIVKVIKTILSLIRKKYVTKKSVEIITKITEFDVDKILIKWRKKFLIS